MLCYCYTHIHSSGWLLWGLRVIRSNALRCLLRNLILARRLCLGMYPIVSCLTMRGDGCLKPHFTVNIYTDVVVQSHLPIKIPVFHLCTLPHNGPGVCIIVTTNTPSTTLSKLLRTMVFNRSFLKISFVPLALVFIRALAAPTPISDEELLAKRQAITTLTTAQITAFKPFTFFASTAYCQPSATLAWNCGGRFCHF